MEVTLNEDNLATYVYDNRNAYTYTIEYKDDVMTKLVWCNKENGDKTTNEFEIEKGNPIKIISDYRSEDAIINYSEKPNKCGLVYLPMIICNTAWGCRALAYAGLMGYGSRTLPSSCKFRISEPLSDIDYTFDSQGYILSMKVTNGNDGNGEWYFEYADVNSIDDIVADESRCNVYSSGNSIFVEADSDDVVEIYNLQGTVIYRGVGSVTRDVQGGVYIVRVNNHTTKLMVR